MKVILISYTPNPEEIVSSSARLCYSNPSDISDILLSNSNNTKLIDMLIGMNHLSPLEHVSFSFGIEGISRACSHQLVRHRIASYSQQSQRYVSMNDFRYVIPPRIRDHSNALEVYEQIISCIKKAYNKLYDILGEEAKEDIRYLLPNATETKIIVTMNARSLLNFFNLRLCNRAQWEIRMLAKKMLDLCMEVAPNIFKHAGPDCKTLGMCKQGKYSCKNKGKLILTDKTLRDLILDDNISAICIPTCGYVITDNISNKNIYPIRITNIGKELLEISEDEKLEEEFGNKILKNGNKVQIIKEYLGKYLISFPVNDDWIENPLENAILERFREKYKNKKYISAALIYSDPEIIERSLNELEELDKEYNFKKILFPDIKTLDDNKKFIHMLSKHEISNKSIVSLNYIDI